MRRLLVSLLAMALAADGPPDAGAAATRSKCQSLTGRDLAPARQVKLVERRNVHDRRRCAMIGGDDCATGASTTAAAAFVTRAGRAVALVFRAATATVSAFSSLGRSRPLDVAAPPDIPPESLRLTGNLAAWTNAGVARRASIP